jgi:hypothetical protein
MTTVAAKIDVGFGNTLFIRGQGNGLSWSQGVPLQCVGESHWIWSTHQAQDRIVFKLLVNDERWSQGPDLVLDAGDKIEVAPRFP